MVKWYQKKELLKRFEAQNKLNMIKYTEAKIKYFAEHKNDPHTCETCEQKKEAYCCRHCKWNPNATLDDCWDPKILHEIWTILNEGIPEIKKEFDV